MLNTKQGTLKLYLPSKQIQEINAALAERINEDYKNVVTPENPLLAIVTLKGAMFFAADLLKYIRVPLCIDFIRLASYGSETRSSGTVRFLKDIETHPGGQHILVLDEIVDSGRTLDFLVKRLKADNPKTLKVCTLLNKPSRREVAVNVDYVGLEVEDKFLIGYGLDMGEHYRNLQDIYYIEQ